MILIREGANHLMAHMKISQALLLATIQHTFNHANLNLAGRREISQRLLLVNSI